MAFEVYLLTGKTGARGSSCQLAAVISCYARHSFLFVKYRSKLEAKLNLYCSTDFSCNVWVQASFQVLKENIFIHKQCPVEWAKDNFYIKLYFNRFCSFRSLFTCERFTLIQPYQLNKSLTVTTITCSTFMEYLCDR